MSDTTDTTMSASEREAARERCHAPCGASARNVNVRCGETSRALRNALDTIDAIESHIPDGYLYDMSIVEAVRNMALNLAHDEALVDKMEDERKRRRMRLASADKQVETLEEIIATKDSEAAELRERNEGLRKEAGDVRSTLLSAHGLKGCGLLTEDLAGSLIAERDQWRERAERAEAERDGLQAALNDAQENRLATKGRAERAEARLKSAHEVVRYVRNHQRNILGACDDGRLGVAAAEEARLSVKAINDLLDGGDTDG